jgi:hypothetical protein
MSTSKKPHVTVWIGGTRNFTNWEIFAEEMDTLAEEYQITHVISGGAKGADELARKWAMLRDYPFWQISADWKQYGKAAGPIRNKDCAKRANLGIFFWDLESRGTSNAVNLSLQHCEHTFVICV